MFRTVSIVVEYDDADQLIDALGRFEASLTQPFTLAPVKSSAKPGIETMRSRLVGSYSTATPPVWRWLGRCITEVHTRRPPRSCNLGRGPVRSGGSSARSVFRTHPMPCCPRHSERAERFPCRGALMVCSTWRLRRSAKAPSSQGPKQIPRTKRRWLKTNRTRPGLRNWRKYRPIPPGSGTKAYFDETKTGLHASAAVEVPVTTGTDVVRFPENNI